MKITRVLIVDDHEILRKGLRVILTQHFDSARILEKADASGAIEALSGDEFDILILDINLPGRSGLEVLREAKRLHPHLPVLILTSSCEEDYAVHALRLGASGYLTKQSLSEELVIAVSQLLGGGAYIAASLAQRLALNLRGGVSVTPHKVLSQRELEVLRLIAVGKTIKEIAQELSLSDKTITTYRARITQKTGLRTNIEIARYALKHKLVE